MKFVAVAMVPLPWLFMLSSSLLGYSCAGFVLTLPTALLRRRARGVGACVAIENDCMGRRVSSVSVWCAGTISRGNTFAFALCARSRLQPYYLCIPEPRYERVDFCCTYVSTASSLRGRLYRKHRVATSRTAFDMKSAHSVLVLVQQQQHNVIRSNSHL